MTTGRVCAAGLRETLSYIEAHPQEWDQDVARRSFIGWAVTRAGGVWNDEDSLRRERGDDPPPRHRTSMNYLHCAAWVLGLTGGQVLDLHGCDNDLDDLRVTVARICAEVECSTRPGSAA